MWLMSKMKYEEALEIAERVEKELEPYCKRIEIAGSIRRKRPECGDIEIVLVKDDVEGLKSVVDKWIKVKGEVTGRYTQRLIEGGKVKLDIFMANEDNWGNIFLIRTGNWVFSRWMMGIKAREMGYKHAGGYLWEPVESDVLWRKENAAKTTPNGVKCICREEKDVFELLDVDWIEPEDRDWE